MTVNPYKYFLRPLFLIGVFFILTISLSGIPMETVKSVEGEGASRVVEMRSVFADSKERQGDEILANTAERGGAFVGRDTSEEGEMKEGILEDSANGKEIKGIDGFPSVGLTDNTPVTPRNNIPNAVETKAQLRTGADDCHIKEDWEHVFKVFPSQKLTPSRYASMGGRGRKRIAVPLVGNELNSDEMEGWSYLTTGRSEFIKPQQALAAFRVTPQEKGSGQNREEETGQDRRIFIVNEYDKVITSFPSGGALAVDPSQIIAVKRQFIEAMERFYGLEVTELALPLTTERAVLLADENPLDVATVTKVIAKADAVGVKIRGYLTQYPAISTELTKAIGEHTGANEAASNAAALSLAEGTPIIHLGTGLWHSSLTVGGSIGAVTVVTCLPHHIASGMVFLTGAVTGFFVDPMFRSAVVGLVNIPESYKNAKEAFAKYKTSSEALKVMQGANANAAQKLSTAQDLLKKQQEEEKELAATIPLALKEKIIASSTGVLIAAVNQEVQKLSDHLAEKENSAASERKAQLEKQQAASLAGDRMDRRLRWNLRRFF